MMSKRENKTQISGEPEALDTEITRRIFKETAEDIPPASPDVFARIEEAITSTAFSEDADPILPPSFLAVLVNRLRDLIAQPRIAWGVAAAQAIVLCLFFAFSSSDHFYQTLSGSQPGVQSTSSASFTVMFKNNATIGEIETLLAHAGATIIGGPGARGIYIITLAQPDNQDRNESLKRLKSSSLVTFIEEAY